MKRLILFELIILFLATTFESDSPPGWFQQVLPRSDVTVQDIFFIDSLTGYAVSRKNTNDSSFIFKTTNGGSIWAANLSENIYLTSIQFVDNNTGYSVGSAPGGIIKKTTNGGLNWFTVNIIAPFPLLDLFFVNKDTGWICSDDSFSGGIFKTEDGGLNWQNQLGPLSFIKKLFFLNKDTGWALSNESSGKLYWTTNGGTNWVIQYTFSSGVGDVYFFNNLTGIVSSSRFYKTTDGGFNWAMSTSTQIGGKMTFVSGFTGWAGQDIFRIAKTVDSGSTWFYQTSPVFNNYSVSGIDSFKAWAGGSGIAHTTDGGGPPVGITPISNEIPEDYMLYQNYPNPFNPVTNIKYSVKRGTSNVKLIIYDIQGKEVTTLVNQKQNAGTYLVDFDAGILTSGIYFYSLSVEGKIIETKKMALVK